MSDALAAQLGRDFEPGQVLFREGDAGEAMYVIQVGRVRLTKLIDAQHTILAELGPGDFLGELAMMAGRPQNTTATVVEPTRCLVLDTWALEALVSGSSEVAVRLVRELGRRLYYTMDLLSVLGHRDATARMIAAVARNAELAGEATGQGTLIHQDLADIARSAAVSEAELGEVARSLERLRLVELKRDGVLVPDVARLYEFIEFAED
jgi:CRP/FNR family transcriptional regulator, cyclic AMP receptor protein